MRKYLYHFAWLIILSALMMISVFVGWTVYPYKTIEFNKDTANVLNMEVKRGEHLTIQVDACRYGNISPEISRSFVDGVIYTVPTTTSEEYIPGCYVRNIHIYIPKALPPGEFFIKTVYRFRLNPVRVIDKTINTIKFVIVS